MAKIYVVTGSEHGVLGAGTNKKEAIRAAEGYVQGEENAPVDVEVPNEHIAFYSSSEHDVTATLEVFESNQY